MADRKLTDLPFAPDVSSAKFYIVDASDTSESPLGTSKYTDIKVINSKKADLVPEGSGFVVPIYQIPAGAINVLTFSDDNLFPPVGAYNTIYISIADAYGAYWDGSAYALLGSGGGGGGGGSANLITANPHTVYLTGTTVQTQLDNTEVTLIDTQKSLKIDFKVLYQTGRVRPDVDTSVATISSPDVLTVTNVNSVLFVNEVLPDTPLNKIGNYVRDFGDKIFGMNSTNTPLVANTRGIFYLGIDKLGNGVFRTERVYDLDVCYLARVLVQNNAGVYSIVNALYYPDLAYNNPTDKGRRVKSAGALRWSGSASISFGNVGVILDKDSVNYANNHSDPNYLVVPDSVGTTPTAFVYLLPNVTNYATPLGTATVINPTQWYNSAGAVGAGAVANGNYQVYKVLLTVTGNIAIQTKASTSNAPQAGVNAIFGSRDDAFAGLTSVSFPQVFPVGDAQQLGTFYLRAGTPANGSGMNNSDDFYFLPTTQTSSSSSVGVTSHDALSGKNDNPTYQHVTTANIAYWNQIVQQSITNGVTTSSPSQDVVFDALALKQSNLLYYAEPSIVPINGSPIATGGQAMALGDGANALGSQSISFGVQAGFNSIGNADAINIGFQAGNTANNTINSVFLGTQAGWKASTSTGSTMIGYHAGYLAPNSKDSVYIGTIAGLQATGSTNAVYIGNNAGNSANNSTNGILIGYGAGQSATNIINSNFIGVDAGALSTATNANYLGFQAGFRQSSSYSTIIGWKAGAQYDGVNFIGNNNIIIGSNISLPTGASNRINIGAVLFGFNTYAVQAGDPVSTPATNGRIAIGKSTDDGVNTLQIGGTLNIGSIAGGTASINNLGIDASGRVVVGRDVFVTSGVYSNGTATFTNTTGGTFNVTGFKTNDIFVTGGTHTAGTTTFKNNTGGTFTVTGYQISDVFVTGGTYANGSALFTNNTGGTFNVTGFKTNDIFVTGGTYANGTSTFTNNTGGTFNVTGYKTDDVFVTGGTYSNGTTIFTNNTGGTFNVTGYKTNDIFVTGGTYTAGTASFTNNTGGTFNVTGFKTNDIFVTGGTYANGTTLFTNNTGGTFNVAGYYTGATDVFVTGGTYNAGTASFTNNTGGTFNVTGFSTGGGTSLLYYKESNVPPVSAPSVTGSRTFVIGDGAIGQSDNSIAFGINSFTNGQNSIAIGVQSKTFSLGSIAIGQQATAQSLDLIALGSSAGLNVLNGAESAIFIGSNAGNNATDATKSVFIGSTAGNNATTSTNSVFIGDQTGISQASSPFSTYIGYKAGNTFALANTLGANNIIIGTNISLPTSSTNRINLGGVIYGFNTYGTTTGNPSLVATPTGRVVIGKETDNGVDRLQVNGTLNIADITGGGASVNNLGIDATGRVVVGSSGGGSSVSQIVITTSVSITTDTLGDAPYATENQNGKNVIISNGASVINLTVNGNIANFVSSYLKHGTGTITFVQAVGRTLVAVNGTLVLNGLQGSTATISSIGTTDYLKINNR